MFLIQMFSNVLRNVKIVSMSLSAEEQLFETDRIGVVPVNFDQTIYHKPAWAPPHHKLRSSRSAWAFSFADNPGASKDLRGIVQTLLRPS